MLSLPWLSRLWSSRRSNTNRRTSRERLKERRLKLMRLEQRRVLNADFSFTPHGLTLNNVDGDLTIREVDSGQTSYIEFVLTGSIWEDLGNSGLTIDNSTANYSVLSIEKSSLEALQHGIAIVADGTLHSLTFDTQGGSLELHQMAGALTIQGFGTVEQSGTQTFSADELAISDVDDVTFGNASIDGQLSVTANHSILLDGTLSASTVELTASHGFIAGDGLLSASSLDLRANGGIYGSALEDPLLVSASWITAVNSGDADVRLSNTHASDTIVETLTTEGGDLSFAQTGGGSLTFVGEVSSGGSSGGRVTLISDGSLTIADSPFDLDSGEGPGGDVLLGNATIHRAIHAGDGDITILGGNPNLVITDNVTAVGSIELQADRDILIHARILAEGPDSDLTITADDDHDGLGGLWLTEQSDATDAQLAADRDIHLYGANLLATGDPLDGVRIDADGAAQQVVAGRDLTLLANIGAGPGFAGDIVINGEQTAGGALTVFTNNLIRLGADQTTGGELLFKSDVQLTNDVEIASGAAVIFDRKLDDDGIATTTSRLSITAVGDVDFVDKVGSRSGDRLDSLTIHDAASINFLDSVALDGDLRATTLSSADVSEGRVNFHGPVTTTAGLAFGNVEITNAGTLIIDSEADFTLAGSFTQNGFGPTELGADITTGSGGVSFAGHVLLADEVTIDTSAGSHDITFRGAIDSEDNGVEAEHNSLTLIAGAGNVSFGSDLGAGTLGDQTLGNLTIVSAGQVIFGEFIDGVPGSGGPLTRIALDGELDIGVGSNVIEHGIEFHNVSGLLTLVTTDDAVRFNGAVTLRTSLDINTNATGDGGNVTFTSAASIDGEPDGNNGLTIDAGQKHVVFNNDIGRTDAIGTFTITQADAGVTFGESDSHLNPDLTGPVTTINTQGPINIGVDANVILGGIVLNGGLSTLAISTPDRTVRLNGPVTLRSDVEINSNKDWTGIPEDDFLPPLSVGATVTFTSSATIDSEDGECNDLTIDAGTQQVLFNNNIGVGVFGDQKIGRLTITQADDGVIFGESDTDLGLGQTGPVTAIATCDEINIGVGLNVIGGAGIVLNGGDQTLHLTTEDASARFNGAVTLNSDLDIDTNAMIDVGGGTVTFTSAATIDSEFSEANDLTIDVGTEQVLFNNNLGETQSLGAFTITRADDGIRFGQSGLTGEADIGQHPDELGLVTVINTDGAIDLGVGANVVEGGIVLNGGLTPLAITTTDDAIRFNGPVTLASDVDINTNATFFTGGATVTFTQAASIDSQHDPLPPSDYNDHPPTPEFNDLQIDAGVGQVLFNNDIGVVQPLGSLTITQADAGVIFGQSDTDLGPGTTGPVNWIYTDDTIDIGVGDHVIGGVGIQLNAGVGTLQITTTDDDVRFNGAIRLLTDLNIDTNSDADQIGGTVTFTESASIDSQEGQFADVTIDAGTKQVLFNNNLGENQSLGTLIIEQADGGVVFGESEERQGPGTTGPVSIITASGPIDIGVGEKVVAGGIVFNGGESGLLITTGDDPPPDADISRPVRFNGPVTLVSDLEINTNASPLEGGRTVIFTESATIDSGPLGEAKDLTIDVGSQQVLFNNNLGVTDPLGLLTIVQADGGVIFGETDTNAGPGTTGPVTLIAVDEGIDIGQLENIIGGTGIVLNGADDTLLITTTDDPIRFNGAVTLASHVEINTNISGIGGDVTFTSAATIDSDAVNDEHNDLVIDAGTEFVFFNNDIGATQSLGTFTITQADGGVYFGQADQFQRPSPLGPVKTITTEGPIDIGVDDNVIVGGIHFEGGVLPNDDGSLPENTVTVTSNTSSIRFNGEGTSKNDLVINAAEGVTLTDESSILTDDQRVLIQDDGTELIRDHSVTINGDTNADQNGDILMGPHTVIDVGDAFIDLRAANVVLGELISDSTEPTDATHPAIRVEATFGSISDSDDPFAEEQETNIIARETGAGVVLLAVTGIGSGNPLETDLFSLFAFNHDLDIEPDGNIDIFADGNIEIHDIGGQADPNLNETNTGSEHKVFLIFVHNQANPLETGDPDRGVIDINVEHGSLRVVDDGSSLLLDEFFDASLAGTAIPTVKSENIIRLTANTIEVDDDIVALQEEIDLGDEIFETIELLARKDFFLSDGRVITTDEHYAGSLVTSEDIDNDGILDPGEDRNGNGTLDLSDPNRDTKPTIFGDDLHEDVIRIVADFDRNGRSKSTYSVRDSNNQLITRDPNRLFVDMNDNGKLDVDDDNNGEDNNNSTTNDLSEDINNNGLLDVDEDANNNGILDPGEDTNGNNRLDYIEDNNGNGILDPGEDINTNGILDRSEDFNGNGILDIHTDGNVFLGAGATISTDSGIQQSIAERPSRGLVGTAFYEDTSIFVSDLNTNGFDENGKLTYLGILTFYVGVPGEKNLIVEIDWGDLSTEGIVNEEAPTYQIPNTRLPNGAYLFDPTVDKFATRFLIPEGGLFYQFPHQYTEAALNQPEGQPGRNSPTDPFQLRFSVSQHTSLSIEGRTINRADGSIQNVPLSAPLDPDTVPLAVLTTTDVRDNPHFLLPRFDSGVVEFTIPTPFTFPLPREAPPVRPELPPAVTLPSGGVLTPPLNNETTRGAAVSSSVTTDEYFELRRIGEEGDLEFKQRLTGKYDGELLLNNRDLFDEFVRERGDGDYEIWFITKDIREGALIERPVIQFRLESGSISPFTDEAIKTFKPYKLEPVPIAPPAAPEGNRGDDADDSNSEESPNSEDDRETMDSSDSDSAIEESSFKRSGNLLFGQPFPDAATDLREDEGLSAIPVFPCAADDDQTAETSSDSANTTTVGVGVLVFANSSSVKRWASRNRSGRFSSAARLARKITAHNP